LPPPRTNPPTRSSPRAANAVGGAGQPAKTEAFDIGKFAGIFAAIGLALGYIGGSAGGDCGRLL